MKKWMVLALFLCIGSTQVFAAEGADAQREAHRQEMKAIKTAQREARKNEPKKDPNAAPGFWQKEGERSGLSSIGGSPSTVFQSLNPMPFFKSQDEQYKARKAAAKGK